MIKSDCSVVKRIILSIQVITISIILFGCGLFPKIKLKDFSESGFKPNNAYAWYKFDDETGTTLKDHSPNGRDGTTVNMEEEDWIIGKLEGALNFDGSEDTVNLGDICDFQAYDLFSIDFWFRSNSILDQNIISRMNSVGSAYEGWHIYIEAGKPSISLNHDQTNGNYIQVRTNSTYTDGSWHHCAFTYDGSSKASGINIYVNGISDGLEVNDDLTGSIHTTTNCYIGTIDELTSDAFEGDLDQMAIYQLVLSGSQVQSRYNSGNGSRYMLDPLATVIKHDPELWLRLNDTLISDAPDVSLNTHVCTLQNMENGDYIPAIVDNGLIFDGVDEDIVFASVDTVNFERTDAFSFECWFKSTASGTNQRILCKLLPSHPYRGWGVFLGGGGKIIFELINTPLDNHLYAISDSLYADSTWKHLVITYDGSSSGSGVNMYINGNSVPIAILYDTLSAATSNTSSAGTIGSISSTSEFFVGTLDEILVYKKELSVSEVSFRYNSDIGTTLMFNKE